ncbi:hypothetical protein SS50377_23800 [Spironucleus salmonicida]|uniref:Uncharacterized protein n=1 Tax=Spironucleus salmonicida TaxID=348837 RepID=V6LQF4_9EUKA|nr:hypothetical protein SS50377_23800 [Spironucleus salmonicida]|eukprot:EST46478.1 Hypothetical protein SS50377_13560 [Spironucleus salmonicida]
MLVLLLLAEPTKCFQDNAELIGIVQQSQYNMLVKNINPQPIKCQAFNNTASTATLNYMDVTAKSIKANFQYFSDRPIEIYFQNVEAAIFKKMAELSIISYSVKLQDELDVSGTFSLIQNTLVNTSNCWNIMTLNYSRSGDSSYINLTANPNDCIITTPTVQFQYLVGSVWKNVAIAPLASPPPDYEGYKKPFVHMTTKFYRVNRSDSTAEVQAQMDDFFIEFSKNRLMKTRLFLEFTQSGSTLTQQIFSPISNIVTVSNECQTAISGFGTISTDFLQVVGDLTQLRECITDIVTVQSSMILNDTQIFDDRLFSVMVGMATLMFKFSSPQDAMLELPSSPNALVIMSFLDADGKVVREEAKEYTISLSCFYKISAIISYAETCIVFFPVQTDRCVQLYSKAAKTRFQQILQADAATASRLIYQVYEFTMPFESVPYFRTCLRENTTSMNTTFTFFQGSYSARQHAFVDTLKTSFQPLVMFNNDYDFQFQYVVGIDQTSLIAMPVSIILVVLFITVGTVFAVLIVRLSQ